MVEQSKYSDHHLQQIEDLVAAGYTYTKIAEILKVSARSFDKDRTKDPYLKAAIEQGKARLAGEAKAQAQYRKNLAEQSIYFAPTDEDLEQIEILASLSWPEPKIMELFRVDTATWMSAKKRQPSIAEALKRGQERAGGKALERQIKEWYPTPKDLEQITFYASEGLGPKEVARKMEIPIATLERRMEELPEVREAYERGMADMTETASGKLKELINKGNIAAIIFYLKARAGWVEKQVQAQQFTEQKPTAKFKAPREDSVDAFQKRVEKHKKEEEERKLRLVQNGQ